MRLERVTVTGADDSISPNDLVGISKEYPFVEWGILITAHSMLDGGPRFPSLQWIEQLLSVHHIHRFNLSVHLCGKWVRQVISGDLSWFDKIPYSLCRLISDAQRMQLNFHAVAHKAKMPEFAELLKRHSRTEFILQSDGVNDEIIRSAHGIAENVVVLHDKSGGAGELPEQWPTPIPGMSNGYAGGLSAANVKFELETLSQIVGDDTIWIDAETRLRTSDNQMLNLAAVCNYLKGAQPWT